MRRGEQPAVIRAKARQRFFQIGFLRPGASNIGIQGDEGKLRAEIHIVVIDGVVLIKIENLRYQNAAVMIAFGRNDRYQAAFGGGDQLILTEP